MIDVLTACQARAARAMLNWSVRKLAIRSKISDSSVRRIEVGFGAPENVTIDLCVKLRAYFESRGFHFTFDDTIGPGVSWNRAATRAERRLMERRGEP